MMEAGVVIDCLGNAVHWHLPPGRSGGALPDSHDLWEVLFRLNNEKVYGGSRLLGFAHSHPGNGDCGPSSTDISTFDAVERGLGRPLYWWITNADTLVLIGRERVFKPATKTELQCEPRIGYADGFGVNEFIGTNPSWVHKLRIVSGLISPTHCLAGRHAMAITDWQALRDGRVHVSSACDAKPEPYSAFCATHIRDEALVRAYFAP